ncbi:FkbM family methyltransferase [Paenibacillus sp. FSL R5-0914]|uniref:FkbM family methyltransferase n=1 Tax=Paenibacillus sp. FSL R5-0914 TaxID=2921665 RepID=UPI0030F5C94D
MNEQSDSVNEPQDPYALNNVTDKKIVEIESYINKMLITRDNNPDIHWRLQSKVRNPFKNILKKVVSRLFKWYTDPLAFQQIEFNNAVTPAIGKSTELLNELLNITKNLNGKIQSTQSEYEELSLRLQIQQEQYDKMIASYNEQLDNINKRYKYYDELILQNEKEKQFISNEVSGFADRLNKLDELKILENTETYYMNSYSQAGEDNILDYVIRVLGIPYSQVTYIDLGANHPKNLSNTYFFYSQGSKGVIVEANPNLIPELKFFRNRDVVLNNCVDTITGNEVEFYIMNVDGLSTTNYESTIDMCEINPALKVIDKKVISSISFNDIAENYLGKAPTILSIDLEGKDIEILHSIDYVKYRPLMIVIEMIDYDIKLAYDTKNMEIKSFIETRGYEEYAYTGINSIFIDKEYLDSKT